MEDKVYEIFDKLNINYSKVEHQPLYKVEESRKIDINLNGIGCKTLFLKDKQDNYYLYVLNGEKRADLKNIAEEINSSRLSFGKEQELYSKTGLIPGSVSPFGILNNSGDIIVLIDNELVNNYIIVHPNINTVSISIYYTDLIKVIDVCKNNYIVV